LRRGVCLGRDRRSVALLEVLGEVSRLPEGGHLKHVALQLVELDPSTEQLAQVVLATPERRRLRAGRRRGGEWPDRAEEAADHPLRGPAQ